LRDVVQALGSRASDVPLCIAPSGTINLVATELGYARKAAIFARELKDAWERGPESTVSAPLYKLGDMPIVACVSIGPDSHAVARVSDALKKRIGRYAYVIALLNQMRDWPRDTMTVRGELDNGSRFECEAQAAIASHGAFFAGPFRLSRKAALHADSVELVTVARSTRIGTVLLSLFAILGLPVSKLSGVEVRSVKRVEFDRCVTPVQVDGDHIPDCAYAIAPSGMTLQYIV
jgi:diacylglycerol kinase family enzyme